MGIRLKVVVGPTNDLSDLKKATPKPEKTDEARLAVKDEVRLVDEVH